MRKRPGVLIVAFLLSGFFELVLADTGPAAADGAVRDPESKAEEERDFFASPAASLEPEILPAPKPRGMPLMLAIQRPNYGLIKAFERAWKLSANGTRNVEAVILVFRMPGGGYKAVSQGYTNERNKFTFKWYPSAVAIVHTHPNDVDPRPTVNDEQLAHRFGVLMFTISRAGMYVYDPKTRKTSKLRDGLGWLEPPVEP